MSEGREMIPDFASWKDTVDSAVQFAEQYPPEIRGAIIQAILMSGRDVASTAGSGSRSFPGVFADAGDAAPGLKAVADDAGVDLQTLQRYILIGEAGKVTVRAPRLALRDTISDHQNHYSAVLAYIREKALGEYETEGTLLHEVCEQYGCMDSNFAQNIRNRSWLLERGDKSATRSYGLSKAGVEAAQVAIRRLCEADR